MYRLRMKHSGRRFLQSRLVRNLNLVKQLKERLTQLHTLSQELLQELPSDFKYLVTVERLSKRKWGRRVYKYNYIEVWENQVSGSNARFIVRLRETEEHFIKAAKLETQLCELRMCLLKLRYLLDEILSEDL